jgi:hypothetical protein
MAIQYSDAIRNAMNDQVEVVPGTGPIFDVYNGTKPTNCAAALSGNTLLAQGTLPSDWLTASSAGLKSKSGTWTLTGQAGAGGGTAGTFFRIYDSTHTTCHWQGTFTATGGGGDMTADNNSIANGQAVTVNTFNITRGNA